MTIDANLIEGFKIGMAVGVVLGFILGFGIGCWVVYTMKIEGKLP